MVPSGVPRKKSPVTPPGIDPGTVRLVAQRLNHYATVHPLYSICNETLDINFNAFWHWTTCIGVDRKAKTQIFIPKYLIFDAGEHEISWFNALHTGLLTSFHRHTFKIYFCVFMGHAVASGSSPRVLDFWSRPDKEGFYGSKVAPRQDFLWVLRCSTVRINST